MTSWQLHSSLKISQYHVVVNYIRLQIVSPKVHGSRACIYIQYPFYSYRLAEKAEELGIITSVVGVHDVVPRISWRALTYLKLLVKKALNETSIKKAGLCAHTHDCIQWAHVNVESVGTEAAVYIHMYMYMYIYVYVEFDICMI